MTNMTKRRLQVLRVLADMLYSGLRPSVSEWGAAAGLTYGGIQSHYSVLLAEKYVSRTPGQARSIEITAIGRKALAEGEK